MSKKYVISPEDIALFRETVKDVKPLKETHKLVLQQKKPKPRKNKFVFSEKKIITSELSDYLREIVTAEQRLFFSSSNLDKKILRDLRSGKIKREAILDLHGLTVAQARETLERFLRECVKNAMRCVHVIHGKGRLQSHNQPVLKNQVNNWLQQHSAVLAFCSAKPAEGGTGAVYVLLRLCCEVF